jgi:hypothetical protein
LPGRRPLAQELATGGDSPLVAPLVELGPGDGAVLRSFFGEQRPPFGCWLWGECCRHQTRGRSGRWLGSRHGGRREASAWRWRRASAQQVGRQGLGRRSAFLPRPGDLDRLLAMGAFHSFPSVLLRNANALLATSTDNVDRHRPIIIRNRGSSKTVRWQNSSTCGAEEHNARSLPVDPRDTPAYSKSSDSN